MILLFVLVTLGQVLVISTMILLPAFAWIEHRFDTRFWHYLALSFSVGYIVSAELYMYQQIQLSDLVPNGTSVITALREYVPIELLGHWLQSALYSCVPVMLLGFFRWWSRPDLLGTFTSRERVGRAFYRLYLALTVLLLPSLFFSFN